MEAIDVPWRMMRLKGTVLEIADWGLKINYFKWENDFSFKSSSPLKQTAQSCLDINDLDKTDKKLGDLFKL